MSEKEMKEMALMVAHRVLKNFEKEREAILEEIPPSVSKQQIAKIKLAFGIADELSAISYRLIEGGEDPILVEATVVLHSLIGGITSGNVMRETARLMQAFADIRSVARH